MTKPKPKKPARGVPAVDVPAPGQQLAKREADPYDMSNPALAFAQLARDKTIDADRLEKLIHLQERIMDRNARVAFNVAFAAMAGEMPVINRRGEIMNKDGRSVRSRFSKLEDIQAAITPVLKQFGFAIRHRTEWPTDKPGIIRIVGILSHIEGHSEESAFEAGADKNDFRTALQDRGSTVSYGRRYTIIDLVNLQQQGLDNDGQAEGEQPKARQRTRPSQTEGPPSAGSNAQADDPITQKQRQRLWVIIRKAGRTEAELKAWLAVAYDIASTKKIRRRDYETICKAVEASGPLPEPQGDNEQQDREPGEEG